MDRLSPEEFVERMRSCKQWAINVNRDVMELQLTIVTQGGDKENWFGPDPRDLSEGAYEVFHNQVERAILLYHDRQNQRLSPWYGGRIRPIDNTDRSQAVNTPARAKLQRSPHRLEFPYRMNDED